MTIDFTRYTAPGVYVTDTSTAVVTPIGLPVPTVTLVGPSRGYQVISQPMVLTTTATALTKRGVLPDSDASPDLAVFKADGTTLEETTDYVLVRGAGPSDVTTIARVANSTAVAEGETVTVSYSYTDAEYFAPRPFEDLQSVENMYGPALVNTEPVDPNGSHVASPISLAARLAFENGTPTVYCVPTEPATAEINEQTRFAEAYSKIAMQSAVTLLVPVFSSFDDDATYNSSVQGLLSAARVHAEQASADGLGRIVLAGVDTNFDDETTSFDELSQAHVSKRMVLAYPHRLQYYNNNLGQSIEIGGPYLAAAYAGRLCANEIRRGLTMEQIFGFTGIPLDIRQEMTKTNMNTLSASGVAVTALGTQNRLVVRHGVTTKMDDLLSREIAVVRTGDALFRLVTEGMENAGLIGDPIDADMILRVQNVLVGVLDTAMQENVILEYLNVAVRQQTLPSGDPTAVECTFTYRPFLPLNYIIVNFAMDVTSGQVIVEEQIAA